MGGFADIRAKAISLVEHAKSQAAQELSEAEFDEIDFSYDLASEFDAGPADFLDKYAPYLGDLSSEERAALAGPAI